MIQIFFYITNTEGKLLLLLLLLIILLLLLLLTLIIIIIVIIINLILLLLCLYEDSIQCTHIYYYTLNIDIYNINYSSFNTK